MRIGLDIGGTKVAAVVLDARGQVVDRSWHDHHARGLDDVAAELAATAERLRSGRSIDAVGVSVAGLVGRDGSVTRGASLDLSGSLDRAVGARLGCPVTVVNDGEATLRAVLADHRAREGAHPRDAVLLTIGTGIGGAIVSDGRPIRGATGLATELGHLPVLPETDEHCVCGSSGCLEQYAGGKGIATRAVLEIEAGRATAALAAVHAAAPTGITTKEVVDAARAGDATALHLMDVAAAALARAVRALCVTVEPGSVLLGGTVAHGASDLLLPAIHRHLAAHWPFAGLTAPPSVELDAIGPYAGAIGAALLSSESHDHTALEGTDHD